MRRPGMEQAEMAQRGGGAAGGDESSSDEDEEVWAVPERRTSRECPRKEAAIAFFLLFVGIVFGFTGLGVALDKGISEAIPFLTLSGIGFIPGAYHTVILYLAWRRYPGYTYDLIPQYQ